MKLKTVKKRFIASKAKYIVCPKRGQQEGLKFWKDSLPVLKRGFWGNGKFKSTPAYMIDFCGRVWGVEGVER